MSALCSSWLLFPAMPLSCASLSLSLAMLALLLLSSRCSLLADCSEADADAEAEAEDWSEYEAEAEALLSEAEAEEDMRKMENAECARSRMLARGSWQEFQFGDSSNKSFVSRQIHTHSVCLRAAGSDAADGVRRGGLRLDVLELCLALDDGLHHHFAVLERQRQVGEGQLAMARRHEVFATHGHQGFEHARVEHFPGSNLLFDHRESCLLEVNRHYV